MKKEIIIIAGPNGSGKSTLASKLNFSCDFINADYCEKKFFNRVKDKNEREKLAIFQVGKAISESIKQNISFAFETVFSTVQIPSFLSKAKKQGYQITLHFIATENPDINISRVAKRVSEGGHDVPKEKIVERYGKSIAILPALLEFVDTATLYDNSHKNLIPFLVKENGEIKLIDVLPKWIDGLDV